MATIEDLATLLQSVIDALTGHTFEERQLPKTTLDPTTEKTVFEQKNALLHGIKLTFDTRDVIATIIINESVTIIGDAYKLDRDGLTQENRMTWWMSANPDPDDTEEFTTLLFTPVRPIRCSKRVELRVKNTNQSRATTLIDGTIRLTSL